MPLPEKKQRNQSIYLDKSQGIKSKEIAQKYGIHRTRVYQILKMMGYNFYAIKD